MDVSQYLFEGEGVPKPPKLFGSRGWNTCSVTAPAPACLTLQDGASRVTVKGRSEHAPVP